jgi:hypothetical protein
MLDTQLDYKSNMTMDIRDFGYKCWGGVDMGFEIFGESGTSWWSCAIHLY